MGDFPSSVPKSFGNLGPELHSASALLILTLTFHLGRGRRLCFSVYKSVTEDPERAGYRAEVFPSPFIYYAQQ